MDSRLVRPAWIILEDNLKVRSVILLFFLPILLFPTTKSPDKNLLLQIGVMLVGGIFFYIASCWALLPPPNYIGQGFNIAVSLGAGIVVIRQLFYFARYFSRVTASLDENDKYADGFRQMQKLIENKYSVNLRYVYRENLETKNGYINVVNPFRATSVIGTPGSGKTYAILEEYMYQMIQKGFSAVIYDYKDPALSKLAYNYLRRSENKQSRLCLYLIQGFESDLSMQSTQKYRFVGRVCDEFDTPFKEKVFHGSIQVDRSHKETPYEIPKLRNYSDEEFDSICRRNLIRIQTKTTNLLSEVQEIANDYLLLRKMTQPDAKTDQNLFTFIEDPDNEENHVHLFVWLELVYKIIDDLEFLELRNDTLTFDEKFDLLLLDVFEGDITGQNLIRRYRQEMHLTDYESVKRSIERVESRKTFSFNGSRSSITSQDINFN